MIYSQKLNSLKELYILKSLGYKYVKAQAFENLNRPLAMPKSLEKISSLVSSCYLCPLSKTRKNVVFGEGNINAKLMFVGEGPGANEDAIGRPFVGRAGELLNNIIKNVLLLNREDVYLANIVKCRPPNNRVPSLDEANVCKAYLHEQIKLINPKVIVALGATSYHHLTEEFDTNISKVRGEIYDFLNSKLVPTYHPSFLLRNPSAKREVYMDMLRVKELLK